MVALSQQVFRNAKRAVKRAMRVVWAVGRAAKATIKSINIQTRMGYGRALYRIDLLMGIAGQVYFVVYEHKVVLFCLIVDSANSYVFEFSQFEEFMRLLTEVYSKKSTYNTTVIDGINFFISRNGENININISRCGRVFAFIMGEYLIIEEQCIKWAIEEYEYTYLKLRYIVA
jgi:hypothetical protein